jgi:succinyl-CoA synthetase beta subunit
LASTPSVMVDTTSGSTPKRNETLVPVGNRLDAGQPDVDSLASVVILIGEILANSNLEEIELNPLAWTGSSWVALDALVRGQTQS